MGDSDPMSTRGLLSQRNIPLSKPIFNESEEATKSSLKSESGNKNKHLAFKSTFYNHKIGKDKKSELKEGLYKSPLQPFSRKFTFASDSRIKVKSSTLVKNAEEEEEVSEEITKMELPTGRKAPKTTRNRFSSCHNQPYYSKKERFHNFV